MNGIVISFMGVNGGYELAKNPNEITLYDVISSIDGQYYFNRCLDNDYICSRTGAEKDCCFHRVFRTITDDVIKILKTYTFDKFIETDNSFLNT